MIEDGRVVWFNRERRKYTRRLKKLCSTIANLKKKFGSESSRVADSSVVDSQSRRVLDLRRRFEYYQNLLLLENNQDPVEFRRFVHLEFAVLAGCFRNSIGHGDIGEVYKGEFQNQTIVLKKLCPMENYISQEAEFEAVVMSLRSVHHENLVKLVGFCCDGKDRVLVSQYVPNRSLHFHLHSNIHTTIDWSTRIKIAAGSAKALTYLHETCQPKILHKGITAANILLDNEFNPKVSDFGITNLYVKTDSMTHITYLLNKPEAHPRPDFTWWRTRIYADPGKQVSEKSDVYSYGVVLLELLSGRMPLVDSVSIVDWAKPLIGEALGNEQNIEQLIDPKLRNKEEMQSCISEIQVMICCAAASVYKPSKDRPQMKQIVEALEMKIPLNEIWDLNTDFVFLEP